MAEAVAVATTRIPPQPGGDVGVLRDRFVIHPAKPLPSLDSVSAKAYLAEDRRDPGYKLFALVSPPELPARARAMEALKGFTCRGLMALIDFGPIAWAPLGRKCMAAIYEQPLGGRVSELIASGKFVISEYEISRRVVEPMVAALHGLSGLGLPHRQIRPGNLFFKDEARTELILGECVTVPPGFDQPIVFEPIERALAGPGGRGEGDIRDDVYSLGASMIALSLGQSFAAKTSESDLMTAKIEQGSFAALLGGARPIVALVEPLRGMLNDSFDERWSLDHLDRWLDGQKQPPLQRRPSAKADVTFLFAGKMHATARSLARSMFENVGEAAKMLRNVDLDAWVRRALGEAETADKIKAALDLARTNPNSPNNSDDHLVARIVMLLDPRGPIRFRGFSYMPDGFGPAFAIEFLRRGDVQAPVETVLREFPAAWYNHLLNFGPEAPQAIKNFNGIRTHLQNTEPGFGIERCLYETNPSLPCQSPLIADEYVSRIEDLLPALDRAASRVDPKTRPMDRHIAAFIAARFEQDIDPHLKAVASPRVETSLIGMLSLLAVIQWKLRLVGLLGLAGWIGGLLGPAINTYHSRTTRRDIEKELPRLVRQGSLPELFDLIDNAEKRRLDHEGYTAAKTEFEAAQAEIAAIEGADSEGMSGSVLKGQQTAVIVALVISFMIVMTFIVIS